MQGNCSNRCSGYVQGVFSSCSHDVSNVQFTYVNGNVHVIVQCSKAVGLMRQWCTYDALVMH